MKRNTIIVILALYSIFACIYGTLQFETLQERIAYLERHQAVQNEDGSYYIRIGDVIIEFEEALR